MKIRCDTSVGKTLSGSLLVGCAARGLVNCSDCRKLFESPRFGETERDPGVDRAGVPGIDN